MGINGVEKSPADAINLTQHIGKRVPSGQRQQMSINKPLPMKPSNRDSNLACHWKALLCITTQTVASVNTYGHTKYLTVTLK